MPNKKEIQKRIKEFIKLMNDAGFANDQIAFENDNDFSFIMCVTKDMNEDYLENLITVDNDNGFTTVECSKYLAPYDEYNVLRYLNTLSLKYDMAFRYSENGDTRRATAVIFMREFEVNEAAIALQDVNYLAMRLFKELVAGKESLDYVEDTGDNGNEAVAQQNTNVIKHETPNVNNTKRLNISSNNSNSGKPSLKLNKKK